MKILSLDTEDDSKGNCLLVNFFDGREHFTFTDIQKAQTWLSRQEPVQVWACNLEYDLLNLYGEWTAKILTLQYVASGLMRAILSDANIICYDTLRHWPMSVEAMGEYIGLKKHKNYLSEIVNHKLINACKRDSEIVWKFTRTMLDRYGNLGLEIKSTLPAMALQLYNQRFSVTDFPRLRKSLRDKFREGYYGGRVEVYRFKEIKGPIYHYDINSLYPHVMKKYEYSDLHSLKMVQKADFNNFGMAKITIDLPLVKYPCLPYRSDKEIIFPYGPMTGVWCYPEIRQALKDGGKIKKIHWAIETSKGYEPFRKYVDYCYGKRLESKTALDNTFWKLMLNSLYGKFASKDRLLTISKDREYIIKSTSRFSNVIWSAYVTTYARLELLKHLRNADDVYYTDTDSIFTSKELSVSKELGALKLEGVYKKSEFFGNKVYVVDDKYKARGIPRKGSAAKDFIRTGRCIFRRPARLRESRRSFAMANVWYEVEKNFNAKYTKRKINKKGLTFPLTLKQYNLII